MGKKSLGSLRVDDRTIQNMKEAIKKYNGENLIEMSESDFRRLSYELLSQMILQNLKIPVKLVK